MKKILAIIVAALCTQALSAAHLWVWNKTTKNIEVRSFSGEKQAEIIQQYMQGQMKGHHDGVFSEGGAEPITRVEWQEAGNPQKFRATLNMGKFDDKIISLLPDGKWEWLEAPRARL